MYVNAVVSFIDILGFRSLVASRTAPEIESILDLVTKFATEEAGRPEALTRTVQFSDSVIRVAPVNVGVNAEAPAGVVFHELLALVHAQAELMNKGVLVRGGVTYGQVALTGTHVFGPAFVRAYDLESNFANFPRIVIDPHLLAAYMEMPLLRASHHSLGEDKAYIRSLICRGDDGIWFVDYARAIREEMDEPDQYPLLLRRQKQLVVAGLAQSTDFDSRLAKYCWLANYHNSVIEDCLEDWCRRGGIRKADLSIPNHEMGLGNPLRIG